MIVFRHLNLEESEAEFNGRQILIKKNQHEDWAIFVNGKLTNAGPFSTRKEAIDTLTGLVRKIEGPKHNRRPKQNGFKPKHGLPIQ
jgi:hypothetical protein